LTALVSEEWASQFPSHAFFFSLPFYIINSSHPRAERKLAMSLGDIEKARPKKKSVKTPKAPAPTAASKASAKKEATRDKRQGKLAKQRGGGNVVVQRTQPGAGKKNAAPAAKKANNNNNNNVPRIVVQVNLKQVGQKAGNSKPAARPQPKKKTANTKPAKVVLH
jgi:hypothetical protein